MTVEEAIERASSALDYRIKRCTEDSKHLPSNISELLLEGARNDKEAIKIISSLAYPNAPLDQ